MELTSDQANIEEIKSKGYELVTSIFDADTVILFGGIYCCEEDPGYTILDQISSKHPTKSILVVHGHHLHEKYLNKPNISHNRFMKFEFL